MKFVLKNRITLIAFCLLVTLPVFSSDESQIANNSSISKFLALFNFFKKPSMMSGVTSFLYGPAIGSIRLLSCFGLALGTATLLPPTLAITVGCGVGYYGLFDSAVLREILKNMQQGLQNHYKKTDDNQQETNKNFCVVKQELTTLQSTGAKNQKETTKNINDVKKQVTIVQSTVEKNHQASTTQLNVFQKTQQQTNQIVASVQSSVSNLTKTVETHHVANGQANKELKKDVKSVEDNVSRVQESVTFIGTDVKAIRTDLNNYSQKIDANELNAEQRHQKNEENYKKTQLKLAIITEGQQETEAGVKNLVLEFGDLKLTMQEQYQKTDEKIVNLANQQIDLQEFLKDALKASEKRLEELTNASSREFKEIAKRQGKDSDAIAFLVNAEKQRQSVQSDCVKPSQQQSQIIENVAKALIARVVLSQIPIIKKTQNPTYGQEELGNNVVIKDFN